MTQDSAASTRLQALLQLLSTADAIWDASRLFFERWDLSPSQFNVLNLLHGNPQGLSQTEVSKALIVHRSNVTGLVDRLEKRGWVERKDEKDDRRAYRLFLTARGTQLMQEVLPEYYRGAEELWGNLSDKRLLQLATDLQAAADSARRIARKAV